MAVHDLLLAEGPRRRKQMVPEGREYHRGPQRSLHLSLTTSSAQTHIATYVKTQDVTENPEEIETDPWKTRIRKLKGK